MKLKKWMALFLVISMAASLTACGGSPGAEKPVQSAEKTGDTGKTEGGEKAEDAESKKSGGTAAPAGTPVTYEEGTPLQIAYIGWGFADETSLMYVKEFDMISSQFNVEYVLSDAWGTSTSAEDVVKVLPSLIEGGAQAVIVHSMSAKIVEICDNAGVYFTLSGEVILDEELQALCDASPYYVGTVALADYNGGYANVKFLAEEMGCKNVAYIRQTTRNLEENRLKGAKQAAADLGVNIVGEYTGEEQEQALRDFIANYPELDGVVIGNGTNGKLDMAAQTLESLGKENDIALVTISSPVGHEAYFDSGTVNLIQAGEGFEPFICSMLLINAMYGHRVDEEPFLDYVQYFPIYESASITDYSTYFSSKSDLLPVPAEAASKEWYKPSNPELSNEWIANWLKTEYNIEAMKKAHGQ